MLPQNVYLRKVDLFKNLSDLILDQIAQAKIEKQYPKNTRFISEGEPAQFIWFVKTGHIRRTKQLSEGHLLALTTIGPGVAFGACCCFSEGKYHCDAVTEVESVLVKVPLAEMKELMRKYPAISVNMVENLASRLHLARDMQTFDHESLEKRLHHILVLLKNEYGNVIPITRRELADLAGTTIESTIRYVKIFERRKMLQTTRGKINVQNLSGLIIHPRG